MKFSKIVAAVTLAVAGMVANAGVIPIDDFNIDGPVLSQSTIGTSGMVWQTGDMVGGSREMQVTKASGPSGKAVVFDVSGGTLNYSSAVSTTGTGYIRWDGNANGLLDFDLHKNYSGFSELNILTNFSDGNFSYELTFWSDPTHYSSVAGRAASVGENGPLDGYTFPAPHTFVFFDKWFTTGGTQASPVSVLVEPHVSGSTTYFYIDAWCGAGGCADFADVNAITAIIDPNALKQSLDMSIDAAYLIPEPGSLALMGLGLIGLAGVASRRKQK